MMGCSKIGEEFKGNNISKWFSYFIMIERCNKNKRFQSEQCKTINEKTTEKNT